MTDVNFSIPFGFNSLGQVNSTSDAKEIWKNRIVLSLATRFGERLLRPDFGSDIDKSLFENPSSATEIVQRSVNIAFNKWLPSLKLDEIAPKYDPDTGYMDITISYTLPSGEKDAVSFNTAIFSRSGDLIQEITRGQ